jgi:hypothetical protein
MRCLSHAAWFGESPAFKVQRSQSTVFDVS